MTLGRDTLGRMTGYLDAGRASMLILLPVLVVGLWIGSGFIGRAIGKPKGLGTAGFWLGFGLGFIGWIIVATMQPPTQGYVFVQPGPVPSAFCTTCGQPTAPGARFCGGCGSPLAAKPYSVAPQAVLPHARVPSSRTARPGTALAITSGCLGLVAVAVLAIANDPDWSSGIGLDLVNVPGILVGVLVITAATLCFPIGTRKIGAASLGGIAGAYVGSSGLYISMADSFRWQVTQGFAWSGGLLILLGAAICSCVRVGRTGISVRGARLPVVIGAGAAALALSVASYWWPTVGHLQLRGGTVEAVLGRIVGGGVWAGVVLVAAAVTDRTARLWMIGSFSAFWLVTAPQWFWVFPDDRYYNYYGPVTVAGWVSLAAVAGLVALFVATNKIGGPANPKSYGQQFPA